MLLRSNPYLAAAVFAVAALVFAPTPARAAGPAVAAPGAMLVDGTTGRILFSHNPDRRMHPASMTKMMTEYLLLEAVHGNTLSWDQKVKPSPYCVKIAGNRGLSNVVLRAGRGYRVRDLYEAMVIFSANGAAIALAEVVAGSESAFVRAMNEKGRQMGLSGFRFVNATGLNNKDLAGMHPEGTEADAENIMTPRATAHLAYRLLRDFPEILETCRIPEKTFMRGTPESQQMRNWNWMLPGMPLAYTGLDGLKTGSTTLAGYNFTATAARSGVRLISVVMGTDSYRTRFRETAKLLDYGFDAFAPRPLVPAGFAGDGTGQMTVSGGKVPVLDVFVESLPEVLAGMDEAGLPTVAVTPVPERADGTGGISAPVAAGDVVAYASAVYDSTRYLGGTVPVPVKHPVVARTAVPRAGWWPVLASTVRGWWLWLKGLVRRVVMRSVRYITDKEMTNDKWQMTNVIRKIMNDKLQMANDKCPAHVPGATAFQREYTETRCQLQWGGGGHLSFVIRHLTLNTMPTSHILTTDGIRLHCRVTAPAGPVRAALCLVHGLGEHGGRYAHVAAALNRAGIAVLAPDLRGHGNSPGKRGYAPSYAALLDDVGSCLAATAEQWPGVPLFLYGHSMGGNLVLNYVLHREPHLAGVIASSAWLRLTTPRSMLLDLFAQVTAWAWPRYTRLTGNDPGEISRDTDVVRAKNDDPLCHDYISTALYTWVRRAGEYVIRHADRLCLPLLVMHGSADGLIDPVPSRLVAERAHDCTYRSWDGYYHELHNDLGREEVITYLMEWVAGKLESVS